MLSGIAQDLSNHEIALKLNLSERTVKFHVSAMLEKFGVRGRTGLVMKAGDFLTPEATQGRRDANSENVTLLVGPSVLTGPTVKPRLMIPMVRRAGR